MLLLDDPELRVGLQVLAYELSLILRPRPSNWFSPKSEHFLVEPFVPPLPLYSSDSNSCLSYIQSPENVLDIFQGLLLNFCTFGFRLQIHTWDLKYWQLGAGFILALLQLWFIFLLLGFGKGLFCWSLLILTRLFPPHKPHKVFRHRILWIFIVDVSSETLLDRVVILFDIPWKSWDLDRQFGVKFRTMVELLFSVRLCRFFPTRAKIQMNGRV